eukprot:1302902-Rhodomonas_salina.2
MLGYAATKLLCNARVCCYALSGTEVAYAATSRLRGIAKERRVQVLNPYPPTRCPGGMVLRQVQHHDGVWYTGTVLRR